MDQPSSLNSFQGWKKLLEDGVTDGIEPRIVFVGTKMDRSDENLSLKITKEMAVAKIQQLDWVQNPAILETNAKSGAGTRNCRTDWDPVRQRPQSTRSRMRS
jgi:hypothetical protein